MKDFKFSRPGPLFAVGIVALLAVLFAWYFRPAASVTPEALLSSDQTVSVQRFGWGILFRPASGDSSLGMVFYPGARVPPEAYAYLARGLAAAGYTSALVSFPLGFAIFAPSTANTVIAALPSVKNWVIGGHSLGGAMAAAYVGKKPGGIAGLFFLAAYPGGGTDLSSSGLPVLSISASNDGLATPAKVSAAHRLLPGGTRYVELAGGNHAQFGEYGLQSGDGSPTLDGAAQRRAVVEEVLGLMDAVQARLR